MNLDNNQNNRIEAMIEKCETDIPEECPLAEEAAEAAVRRVFAILGVDINIPSEVENFRNNLRFGANLRRYADKGMLAFIGGLSLFLLAAIGAGVVKTISSIMVAH